MSKFLKHLPCPKCGSKDNYGEYSDHFWCFGCRYFKPKDDITNVRSRYNSRNSQELEEDNVSINTTEDIPKEALTWLFSYGITPEEIKTFGISWSIEKESLILVNHPNYYQGRCFGNSKIKYMSKGKKPLIFYGHSDKLVCVEDVLSAIKISRLAPDWCAIPLLGCSMPEELITSVLRRFNSVVIWLDRDKAKNALEIARNLKQRGFNSSIVVSPLDPKEYSKEELNEWLKNK